jgi:hypothetical protein
MLGSLNKFIKINIYKLFKENGEHCQISYINDYEIWMISSKNVAILANNRKDLDCYSDKERFIWPKLIAN